jgi:phosphohistidine phosphatase
VILYFLRHGASGPSDAGDAQELTDDGRAALVAAAPFWRRLNLRPDLIVGSPLPRARQSAELLATAIGAEAPRADERLAPGADWRAMATLLADHPDARRVCFVGHEPDLSSAISELTGAASVRMRKGGLACVEFPGAPEPGAGELAWLIDPDLYTDDAAG